MYPFFYNPATQDVRFYQDFTFDIQTASTDLSLQSVDTNQTTYGPGDTVSVTLVISNAGSAQDVIVEATVKSHPDTPVDGLPLRNLHDLTGLAVATFAWDSSRTPDTVNTSSKSNCATWTATSSPPARRSSRWVSRAAQ